MELGQDAASGQRGPLQRPLATAALHGTGPSTAPCSSTRPEAKRRPCPACAQTPARCRAGSGSGLRIAVGLWPDPGSRIYRQSFSCGFSLERSGPSTRSKRGSSMKGRSTTAYTLQGRHMQCCLCSFGLPCEALTIEVQPEVHRIEVDKPEMIFLANDGRAWLMGSVIGKGRREGLLHQLSHGGRDTSLVILFKLR